MRIILLAGAAALALCACHKTPPAGASSAAASASSSGGNATASVGGEPMRRAGLWVQTMSRDGQATPMGTMRMCLDVATQAKMSLFGKSAVGKMCQQQSVSRSLDGSYRFSSTCSMGGGTITSSGTASGDYQSKYVVHSESDTTGASLAAMNGHHVTDIVATWMGPCPSDMVPGDVMVGGFKMNLNTVNAGAMPTAGD